MKHYTFAILIISLIALSACANNLDNRDGDVQLGELCSKNIYREVTRCGEYLKAEYNNVGGGITWINSSSGEEIRCPVVGPDSMSAECKALAENPPSCTQRIQCQTPGEEPRACCMAMTASCLACSEGISVEEYCTKNPNAIGCEKETPKEETPCPVERQEACTKEYMPVCGKIGLNMGDTIFQTYGNKCEACAAMKVESYTQGECDTITKDRNYKSTDTNVCARIKFACPEGKQYFGDETGCGCEPDTTTTNTFTECTAEQRNGDGCIAVYKPVCGSVDNGIRCIKAPCPSTDTTTFSNSCFACNDPKVYGYWNGPCGTDGKKPAEGAVWCEKMDPEGPCTMDYTPVCGNDGQTYGNACGACRAQNQYYVPGECVTTEPVPSPKLAAPQVICSTDEERAVAANVGLRCVDTCPADTYTGQDTMRYCIEHYTKTEALAMEKCTKSTDCPSESQCGYASRGTDGKTISWSVKSDGYRCLPNPYANYLVLSGLEILDENGKSVITMA